MPIASLPCRTTAHASVRRGCQRRTAAVFANRFTKHYYGPASSSVASCSHVVSVTLKVHHNCVASHGALCNAGQRFATHYPVSIACSATEQNNAKGAGVLTKEFGDQAMQLLACAAAVARTQSQDMDASWAEHATVPCINITEHHLMLALLQQEPQLLQLLGQHMVVRRGSAAEAARQNITDKLSDLPTTTDIVTSVQGLQLSQGLLDALNSCLHITRCLDMAAITPAAFLWGLMSAPDAHIAYEQTLGVNLYSGDLANELKLLMANQQAETKELAGSSAVGNDPSTASMQQPLSSISERNRQTESSMIDSILDDALNQAKLKLDQPNTASRQDAVLYLCAAVTATANSKFRPTSSWLQQAWETMAAALSADSWLTSRDAVITAILGAAYASVCTLHFCSESLKSVFNQVPASRLMLSNRAQSAAWLQWLATGGTLGDSVLNQAVEKETNILSSSRSQDRLSAIHTAVQEGSARLLAASLPALTNISNIESEVQSSSYSIAIYSRSRKYDITACNSQLVWGGLLACSKAPPSSHRNEWEGLAHDIAGYFSSSACCDRALAISTEQAAQVLASLADSGMYVSDKSALIDQLQNRLQHQPLPLVAQLAAALLGHGNTAWLGFRQLADWVTLAAAALPAMTLEQLDIYLAATVLLQNHEQMKQLLETKKSFNNTSINSHTPSYGYSMLSQEELDLLSKVHIITSEQLPLTAVPTVVAALNAAPADTQLSSGTATAVSSILGSLCQLNISIPANTNDTVQQLCQQLPRLQPVLEPNELAAVLRFVASQQMHDGKRLGHAVANTSSTIPQNSTTTALAGAVSDPAVAYCTEDTDSLDTKAAAVVAALKHSSNDDELLQKVRQVLVSAAASTAAQILCDMAQALGASKLPVEAAVMDVLAGHVSKHLPQFSSHQLPVLLWAFVRKQPTSAAAGVMQQLAEKVVQANDALTDKGRQVCDWATAQLYAVNLLSS